MSEPVTREAPQHEADAIGWRGALRRGGPGALAALFVVPYLVLMVAWALSNPPGAAPDEPANLIKAIGSAGLHAGGPGPAPIGKLTPLEERDASITRIYPIPAKLWPSGYSCMAFLPEKSARCLLTPPPLGHGTLLEPTDIGSYPPFLWVPVGLAADLTSTPYRAIIAARIVCLLMSSILIWLGVRHLIRWLGRPALIGAFVALTPMTVFISASVSLSGVEITAGFAVAAVAVVAIRHPDSLRADGGQLLLAVVGAALILSRQLGIVTFLAAIVLLLVRLGWRFFWELIRAHRPAFLSAVAILVAAGAALAFWERRYDHPVNTGPAFSNRALGGLSVQGYEILKSAVGRFGWLDTNMPRWAYSTYLVILVVLVGLAILLGNTADRWTLVGWLLATVAVAYFAYATVFYTVHAGLQGRHVLPFFMMVPLLSGAVLAERFSEIGPEVHRRLLRLLAVVLPVLQFVGLYMNARRYAVGDNGPMWFFSDSQWEPRGGWMPWLVLGLLAVLALGVVIRSCALPGVVVPRERVADVER